MSKVSKIRHTELDRRFWKFVNLDGPPGPDGEPCWLWEGSTTKDGYGRFHWNGSMQLAHVLAYRKLKGPWPPGLELDHLCFRPGCCNPAHLEPVTHDENMRRRK